MDGHFPGSEIDFFEPGNLFFEVDPFPMLFLLYSATVLVCWFVTRKFLLGVLLAVPVDVALYALSRAVM
jgi:hypothetical protein